MELLVYILLIANTHLVLSDDNVAMESDIRYQKTYKVPRSHYTEENIHTLGKNVGNTLKKLEDGSQNQIQTYKYVKEGYVRDGGGIRYPHGVTQELQSAAESYTHESQSGLQEVTSEDHSPSHIQVQQVPVHQLQLFGSETSLNEPVEGKHGERASGYTSFVHHVSPREDNEELKSAIKEGSINDIKRLVPKSGMSFKIYHHAKTTVQKPKQQTVQYYTQQEKPVQQDLHQQQSHLQQAQQLQQAQAHAQLQLQQVQQVQQHLQQAQKEQQQLHHTQQAQHQLQHSQQIHQAHQVQQQLQQVQKEQQQLHHAQLVQQQLQQAQQVQHKLHQAQLQHAQHEQQLQLAQQEQRQLHQAQQVQQLQKLHQAYQLRQSQQLQHPQQQFKIQVPPIHKVRVPTEAQKVIYIKHPRPKESQKSSYQVVGTTAQVQKPEIPQYSVNINTHYHENVKEEQPKYYPQVDGYTQTPQPSPEPQFAIAQKDQTYNAIAVNSNPEIEHQEYAIEQQEPAKVHEQLNEIVSTSPETLHYQSSPYVDVDVLKSSQSFDHQKALEGSTSFDIQNAIGTTERQPSLHQPEIHQPVTYLPLLQTPGALLGNFGGFGFGLDTLGSTSELSYPVVSINGKLNHGHVLNSIHHQPLRLHLSKEEHDKGQTVQHFYREIPFLKHPQDIQFQPAKQTFQQQFKAPAADFFDKQKIQVLVNPEITFMQEQGKKIIPILRKKRKNRSNVESVVMGRPTNQGPVKPSLRQDKTIRINHHPDGSASQRKNEFSVSASYKVDRSLQNADAA